jgi:hypothetical protein
MIDGKKKTDNLRCLRCWSKFPIDKYDYDEFLNKYCNENSIDLNKDKVNIK